MTQRSDPTPLERAFGVGYDPAIAGPDPDSDCPARADVPESHELYGNEVEIVEDKRETIDGAEYVLKRCTGCGRTWWEGV